VTTGQCAHCQMRWKVDPRLNVLRGHPRPSGGHCAGSATMPVPGTEVTKVSISVNLLA
jgi:hypothetical protein